MLTSFEFKRTISVFVIAYVMYDTYNTYHTYRTY